MTFKFISKNIPFFFLIGVLIILAYQIYDLNEKFGVRVVEDIDLKTNFFNVTGHLITERKADYVFPTDGLRYQLEWKNKIDDPIDLSFRLEGIIGEDNSFSQPKDFGTITLSKDGISKTSHPFTLDKEGQHNLKYIITVRNHIDGKGLELKEIQDKIQVLSRSDQLQQDSNQWILLGIVISASIAGAAAFTTVYEMRRSREEKQNTTRAMIGLESQLMNILSYIDVNGDEKTENEIKELNKKGEKFDWTEIRRSLTLKNYGTLPAMDVKSRSKIISGREPKLKEINSLDFGTGAMIFPNGTQPFIFKFTKEMEDKMDSSTENTYFLFEAQYTSTNSGKIRKMGLLLKLCMGHYTVTKNWDESNSP